MQKGTYQLKTNVAFSTKRLSNDFMYIFPIHWTSLFHHLTKRHLIYNFLKLHFKIKVRFSVITIWIYMLNIFKDVYIQLIDGNMISCKSAYARFPAPRAFDILCRCGGCTDRKLAGPAWGVYLLWPSQGLVRISYMYSVFWLFHLPTGKRELLYFIHHIHRVDPTLQFLSKYFFKLWACNHAISTDQYNCYNTYFQS